MVHRLRPEGINMSSPSMHVSEWPVSHFGPQLDSLGRATANPIPHSQDCVALASQQTTTEYAWQGSSFSSRYQTRILNLVNYYRRETHSNPAKLRAFSAIKPILGGIGLVARLPVPINCRRRRQGHPTTFNWSWEYCKSPQMNVFCVFARNPTKV